LPRAFFRFGAVFFRFAAFRFAGLLLAAFRRAGFLAAFRLGAAFFFAAFFRFGAAFFLTAGVGAGFGAAGAGGGGGAGVQAGGAGGCGGMDDGGSHPPIPVMSSNSMSVPPNGFGAAVARSSGSIHCLRISTSQAVRRG
jgi:hypothetical protein